MKQRYQLLSDIHIACLPIVILHCYTTTIAHFYNLTATHVSLFIYFYNYTNLLCEAPAHVYHLVIIINESHIHHVANI